MQKHGGRDVRTRMGSDLPHFHHVGRVWEIHLE
jgi:hypothetical protein